MQVSLVNMPFAALARPSIALGLIDGYLKQAGISSQVIYANLLLAEKTGVRYTDMIEKINHENLCGEWIFSRVAFPDMDDNTDDYMALFPDMNPNLKTLICQYRRYATRFIHELADSIVQESPAIVACSSTFQQNCGSLALLRVIKQKQPDIITMMGGANCEGVMGKAVSRCFDWVDYVFSGECDNVIVDIVEQLIEGKQLPTGSFDGIISRIDQPVASDAATTSVAPRATVDDMSSVGMPNYDDYFQTIQRNQLHREIQPGLLLETSRGCWWGVKKHCTFCGLNGTNMQYRAKSEAKVLHEAEAMFERYGITSFEVVDNIMPASYITGLMHSLKAQGTPYSFFYETKSNLKKAQMQAMAEGGVRWIQAGIESLHDDFLALIDKGVSAVHNVATLKWCASYDVRIFWNMLACAPGEKDAWYQEMADWLPLIAHLPAPRQKMIKIRYARFSPYFERADDYGLRMTPLTSYAYIYPVSDADLHDLAYFFQSDTGEDHATYSLETSFAFTGDGRTQFNDVLDIWLNQHWQDECPPRLDMTCDAGVITITDSRPVATAAVHRLTGLAADIYQQCESPISHDRLMRQLAAGSAATADEVNACLEQLISAKLILMLSGRYLSLAVEDYAHALPPLNNHPGGSVKPLPLEKTEENTSAKDSNETESLDALKALLFKKLLAGTTTEHKE